MDNARHEPNDRELRKAAARAFKKVTSSLKQEPSTVIVSGSETEEPENLVDEITSWLFHRRQDNGGTSR